MPNKDLDVQSQAELLYQPDFIVVPVERPVPAAIAASRKARARHDLQAPNPSMSGQIFRCFPQALSGFTSPQQRAANLLKSMVKIALLVAEMMSLQNNEIGLDLDNQEDEIRRGWLREDHSP